MNPTSHSSHQALLVVDNMIQRRLIGRLLTHKGLTVFDTTSQGVADISLPTPIDIIFVDVVTTNDLASKVVHQLEQRFPTNTPPIIAMTSYSELPNDIASLFDGTLQKPLQEEDLRSLLIRLLPECEPEYPELVFDQDAFEDQYLDIKLRIEIVELLLTDPVALPATLDDTFDTKNPDLVYDKIHYLKASFNYLKANRLVGIVQHMLNLLKQDEIEAAFGLRNTFMANYQVLRDTLNIYLKSMKQ
jgi:CheY-like chemotaxis protein